MTNPPLLAKMGVTTMAAADGAEPARDLELWIALGALTSAWSKYEFFLFTLFDAALGGFDL